MYWWHEKYRPRKPKYFNRVHTGYEWNKYNQTHYDHDNPPPKVVQGYKFNIFYPDLIDKSVVRSLNPSNVPLGGGIQSECARPAQQSTPTLICDVMGRRQGPCAVSKCMFALEVTKGSQQHVSLLKCHRAYTHAHAPA